MEQVQVNLTVQDLIDQVSSSTGRNISFELIKEFGIKGYLSFIVPHPDNGVFKFKSSWDAADGKIYTSDYLPINKSIVGQIISSDTPLRISTIEVSIDGKVKSLTLNPYHRCDKNDLRIQMEEALRFEKFVLNIPKAVDGNNFCTSKDLFEFIPERKHGLFLIITELIDDLIHATNNVPSKQAIWLELCRKFNTDYDSKTKCIKNLSKSQSGLSYKAFSQRFKDWGWKSEN